MYADIKLDEYVRRARKVAIIEGQIPWHQKRLQRLAKLTFDIIVAALLLILLWPLMVIVGILVHVTSKGPVLLAQTRIGLDGVPFRMYKFRSMRADLPDGSAKGSGDVTRFDPRLTPIGGWLRAWRFDELPQLVHVLSGKMSLVGPRPEIPENLGLYTPDQMLRFAMPPGCADWDFICGAFANDWSTRQDTNVRYVRNWSLWLDFKIIIKTFFVLLSQKNVTPESSTVCVKSSDVKLKVGKAASIKGAVEDTVLMRPLRDEQQQYSCDLQATLLWPLSRGRQRRPEDGAQSKRKFL